MKRNKFVISALLLIGTNQQSWSQSGTYLGVTGFITNDLYAIKDNSSYLKQVRLLSGAFGVVIRQELNKNLFFETGFDRKTYTQGIGYKDMLSYSGSNALSTWIVPVRVGHKLKLIKKLYVVPVVGFSVAINEDYGHSGLGYGTSNSSQTSIEYSFTDSSGDKRIFTLLNAIVNLELDLQDIQLGIYSGRSFGFSTINQMDITYSVNGSQPIKATSTSKGQYWCYGFSIKYRISNLWKKE